MTPPETKQERRERRADERKRNNADIRPWVSIGEAAELVLSAIAAKMGKPE